MVEVVSLLSLEVSAVDESSLALVEESSAELLLSALVAVLSSTDCESSPELCSPEAELLPSDAVFELEASSLPLASELASLAESALFDAVELLFSSELVSPLAVELEQPLVAKIAVQASVRPRYWEMVGRRMDGSLTGRSAHTGQLQAAAVEPFE